LPLQQRFVTFLCDVQKIRNILRPGTRETPPLSSDSFSNQYWQRETQGRITAGTADAMNAKF
jgi:hypothetical protein